MQIGEVVGRARRAIERFHVGRQLDQVAADEPRRDPQMAQYLDQQPAAVAAGAALQSQGFFRRLDARLHPHHILDRVGDASVQRHQKIGGLHLFARHAAEEIAQRRAGKQCIEVRLELAFQLGLVCERIMFGFRLQEEVERIVDDHVRDEVDPYDEGRDLVRKHDPCQEVAERVLLPVQKVTGRLDRQRIAQNGRARVSRRAESDRLRTETDRPVVLIARLMCQRYVNCHLDSWNPNQRTTLLSTTANGNQPAAAAYISRQK